VDVHIVRVPRHRGSALDAYENGPFATKPIVDEAAEQLWPKGPNGKPKSKPNDSARWLRWSYGERLHRKAKNPRRMTQRGDWMPGPPDPPNRVTELCEIWIAEREDCQCFCGELRQAMRQWAQRPGRPQHPQSPEEIRLLEAFRRLDGELCGCGRSMLPIRWARGEL
jgi:hypothetical protein